MKIAVCLIAGNEAGLIDRALDSAFSVTDTVIVVRATGGLTPDQTLDVARQPQQPARGGCGRGWDGGVAGGRVSDGEPDRGPV
jgi:hypothetical protein